MIVFVLLAALFMHARPAVDELQLASSRGYPFLVHALRVDEPTAVAVRDALDEFWYAEIVIDGWPAPLPDDAGPDAGLDVYIDPKLGQGESYVQGETQVGQSMSCYMALPAQWDTPKQLRSFVAHELNHTSQYALDCDIDDAFYEHTAVWVEARAVADHDTWSVGVPVFQAHPERALIYLGKASDEYEYGAALWLMYYATEPAQVQALWRGGTNYFTALGDRRAFFAGFAGWRFSIQPTPRTAPLALGAGNHRLNTLLGMFGTSYWRVEAPPPVLYTQHGNNAVVTFLALDAAGNVIEAQVDAWHAPAGTQALVVALTRISETYDAASGDFRERATRATLGTEASVIGTLEEGLGDGDGDLNGDPSGGTVIAPRSGCAATNSPWGLVVLFAFVGMRWRQQGRTSGR